MRRNPFGYGREDGIAMIMAVVAVFLLSVAVLGTRSGVDLATEVAVSTAREIQAGYLARSGLAMVSAALAEDKTDVDSFSDDWAAANDLGAVPIADIGWAVGTVDDEEGKLNILDLVNDDLQTTETTELVAIRLLDLLFFIGLDESRAEEIVDSLVDWMDEDGTVTGLGAENPYYESQVPGYSCPNRRPQTIDELALVKGIGPALLYHGEGDVPPLADFITVYGDGKVNINTAPMEVLMALVQEDTTKTGEIMDRDLAEEVVAFREEEPFSNTADIKLVPGIGNDFYSQDLAPLIDVSSSHFSARITGETPSASSKAYGVFRRTGQSVKLVYYKGF